MRDALPTYKRHHEFASSSASAAAKRVKRKAEKNPLCIGMVVQRTLFVALD